MVAAGMGCLLPLSLRSGMNTVGVRFSLGYATMAVLAYVFHILLSIPLGTTVTALGILALVGFFLQVYRTGSKIDWSSLLVHPALLLIVAGALAITLNGGIDYLPFTNDEFSHWLMTPRLIHLSGSWAEVADILHLSYYPPGWTMTLLLPWQLSGNIELGLSAAAPFVLHVAVIALIYDFVTFLLKQRTKMPAAMVKLVTWAIVLLLLAAEAMGRLWSYTLLIEQPQIYTYAAVALLIYIAETTGRDRKVLYGVAGCILAASYLFKVAAIAFVPAVFGIAGVMLFVGRTDTVSRRFNDALITATLLVGPLLIAAASWSMAMDAKACSPLTLTEEQWAEVMKLDWLDLARRFGAAVWEYVATYKTPLTLAASLGIVGALIYKKYQAILVMLVLIAIYFLALYATHLVCLGPYYFENLNSIPRFTRVPLQMIHAVGLVMLVDTVLTVFERRQSPGQEWFLRERHKPWIITGLVALIVVGGGWQGRQVYRSIVDTTTRAYQTIDPRIRDAREAADLIDRLRGSVLPQTPVLALVCQGCDNVAIKYARFFAMDYKNGELDPRFIVLGQTSWAVQPANPWQAKASIDDVVEQLSKADIIWPIKTDPWLLQALTRLVADNTCLSDLPDKILVRDTAEGNSIRFRCIEKPEPASAKTLSNQSGSRVFDGWLHRKYSYLRTNTSREEAS